MQNVSQVMPAAPWVAVYTKTGFGGKEDMRDERPLIGWALVEPLSTIRPSVRPGEQRLIGLVSNGRAVQLVDEAAGDFIGYELPLHLQQRTDLTATQAQAEWDTKFTEPDYSAPF